MASYLTRLNVVEKEHNITGPGTTKIFSVDEFKANCAQQPRQPSQLQESDSLDADLSQEMGITTDALKQIQKTCE